MRGKPADFMSTETDTKTAELDPRIELGKLTKKELIEQLAAAWRELDVERGKDVEIENAATAIEKRIHEVVEKFEAAERELKTERESHDRTRATFNRLLDLIHSIDIFVRAKKRPSIKWLREFIVQSLRYSPDFDGAAGSAYGTTDRALGRGWR